MQNLRAVARDFLRLVVMQRAQQPRGGDRARIGAEHSRDIGPNLETHRGQLGGEIRARGIRASAAEQHRFPRIVRGDESLRDDHPAERGPRALQSLVRCEVARSRQKARPHVGAMAVLGMQHRARIHPGGRNSLCVQEGGAQAGGHELAQGHDVRARPIVEAACPFHLRGLGLELREKAIEIPGGDHAETLREFAVDRFDSIQPRTVLTGQRGREQRLQPVGDSGYGRVDDDGTQALVHALTKNARDVVPIGGRRNAGSAEFEHHPGRRARKGVNRLRRFRAALFPTAAPPRRPRRGSTRPCHVCPWAPPWAGVRYAPSQDRSRVESSASPRNSSSMSKCSSSRSLIGREKPLKSTGSICPGHEVAHYSGFCIAFN